MDELRFWFWLWNTDTNRCVFVVWGCWAALFISLDITSSLIDHWRTNRREKR